MKYNLDELHWQEFEVLSHKILQFLITPYVQLLEGGNDKGRDMVYEGKSNAYYTDYSGKWVFQAKHKSKTLSEKELQTVLSSDLKTELQKVFVTNGLKYDNFILVTNKPISADLFDVLNTVFSKFKAAAKIKCKHFNIISYRDIESCIDTNESLKWAYPNIISHPDFRLLIQQALNYHLENRHKGWLNGLEKQRPRFVYTQFFRNAIDKLQEYPAIILSGPPKSGKTFNAEMLALEFSVFKGYQPLLIDNPDEIEGAYEPERNQIFICDDAFGKFELSDRAEEWFSKLERILNLADPSHLFIFTSKEYIFQAFIHYGNDNARAMLEKIIVGSHNYSHQEKLAILYRYTMMAVISETDKEAIIEKEAELISHKNFSPETIRAFFSNIDAGRNGSQLIELKWHLEKPDSYLTNIFYHLPAVKQAALLAVLCTVNNDERTIYDTFHLICNDLELHDIMNTALEFSELDDSILKIQRAASIEAIQFYHPSMYEFLTRQLINNEVGKLKEVVLKNMNNTLLALSVLKNSTSFFALQPLAASAIALSRHDTAFVKTGIARLLEKQAITLYQVGAIFNWLKSELHTIELKMSDPVFFDTAKTIVIGLLEKIKTDGFYQQHKKESETAWSFLLVAVKNATELYSINSNEYAFNYFKPLLLLKKQSDAYWMLVLRMLRISGEAFIMEAVGRDWLNYFYTELKNDINQLGAEIFGDDFPDFKEYEAQRKNRDVTGAVVEKLKEKPNNTWYPRYLHVQNRMDVLKEVKGTNIGHKIVEPLSKGYDAIRKQSEYARNRHKFIVAKGWWKELDSLPLP